MYRIKDGQVQVFILHLGGPLFQHRWDGYWSIPKGLVEDGEELLQTAKREFEEETGKPPDGTDYVYLSTIVTKHGKLIHAWAFEGDWPEGEPIHSNLFSMEWPPNSGQMQDFPENDQGQFFSIDEARGKINIKQVEFLDRLLDFLVKIGRL